MQKANLKGLCWCIATLLWWRPAGYWLWSWATGKEEEGKERKKNQKWKINSQINSKNSDSWDSPAKLRVKTFWAQLTPSRYIGPSWLPRASNKKHLPLLCDHFGVTNLVSKLWCPLTCDTQRDRICYLGLSLRNIPPLIFEWIFQMDSFCYPVLSQITRRCNTISYKWDGSCGMDGIRVGWDVGHLTVQMM